MDNVVYDLIVEVRKGDRVAEKFLQVEITPGVPPLMLIHCADPLLCFPDPQGTVFINPTSRLALTSECSFEDGSNCKAPLTYEWKVADQDGNELSEADMEPHFPAEGNEQEDVTVAVELFSSALLPDPPDPATQGKRFEVVLSAWNGDNVRGEREHSRQTFFCQVPFVATNIHEAHASNKKVYIFFSLPRKDKDVPPAEQATDSRRLQHQPNHHRVRRARLPRVRELERPGLDGREHGGDTVIHYLG